jgi:hypothetical protein
VARFVGLKVSARPPPHRRGGRARARLVRPVVAVSRFQCEQRRGNAFSRPAGRAIIELVRKWIADITADRIKVFDARQEAKLVMTVRLFCALSITVRIAVACLFVGLVLGICLSSQLPSVPGS